MANFHEDLISEVNETTARVPAKTDENEVAPKGFSTKNLELKFPNGEKLVYPDIQIKDGEKVLLTGDSGTGKSTLFKLILGELKPSKGKVIFQDEKGQSIKPDMRELGTFRKIQVSFQPQLRIISQCLMIN